MDGPDRGRLDAFLSGSALMYLLAAQGRWWLWYVLNAIIFVGLGLRALDNWNMER